MPSLSFASRRLRPFSVIGVDDYIGDIRIGDHLTDIDRSLSRHGALRRAVLSSAWKVRATVVALTKYLRCLWAVLIVLGVVISILVLTNSALGDGMGRRHRSRRDAGNQRKHEE
jgi:hypothetical protein